MNRNRVKRMVEFLVTSALLAFAPVAYGGDGPVTVAPPPTLPFQPPAPKFGVLARFPARITCRKPLDRPVFP